MTCSSSAGLSAAQGTRSRASTAMFVTQLGCLARANRRCNLANVHKIYRKLRIQVSLTVFCVLLQSLTALRCCAAFAVIKLVDSTMACIPAKAAR